MPLGFSEDKEKQANIERHQFGRPEANPTGKPADAGAMRAFFMWLSQASEAEITDFVANQSKPLVMRRYAQKMIQEGSIKDMHDFTEQIAGKPKQVIDVQNLPEINCTAFGKD